METSEIPVYMESNIGQVLLGTLHLPDEAAAVLVDIDTKLILSPVIQVGDPEWCRDADQARFQVELIGLSAHFEPAVEAEDPPF